MRKLGLKLDDIDVTGFEVTAGPANAVGTVNAADALTIRTQCMQLTCEHSCNISVCPEDC